MTATGWIGEEPEAAAPAMPLAALALARRERRAGPLETALARSRADDARAARDELAAAPDPDERAAGLIARGLTPGMVSQLSMRLADTEAELAAEEDKIEKAARRAERMHREHEAGRIGAFDIMRALGNSDEGDKDRVRVLERRRDSLQRQIREAAEAMTPPEARAQNAVEEAASRASRILAEVTSQRQAEDQAALAARAQLQRERSSFYTSRGRRPFASRSGAAVECADCRECGLGPEESAAVHAEMDAQKAAEEADRAAYAPGSVITMGYDGGLAYR